MMMSIFMQNSSPRGMTAASRGLQAQGPSGLFCCGSARVTRLGVFVTPRSMERHDENVIGKTSDQVVGAVFLAALVIRGRTLVSFCYAAFADVWRQPGSCLRMGTSRWGLSRDRDVRQALRFSLIISTVLSRCFQRIVVCRRRGLFPCPA